jgi:hypothetical protein
MKPVRILLLSLGVLVAILIFTVVLALNSGVQTWAARKALASQPALQASLGSLSVGLNRVEIQSVRAEQNGAVLTLPALTVELPLVSAGFSKKVTVTKLVARGWTLDLTKATPLSATPAGAPAKLTTGVAGSRPVGLSSSALAADPAAAIPAVAQAFQGVFSQLQLPVDLSLDGLDLDGDIILPPAPNGGPAARAHLSVAGGGLGAGRDGRFTLDSVVNFTGEKLAVSNVTVHSTVVATMDTPRIFTKFVAEPTAIATGPQFPSGVKLSAHVSVARAAAGETYSLTLATPAQQLVAVAAELNAASRTVVGTWKIDVHSADLAPFTLGRALPTFAAAGDGKFSTDTGFAEIRASGRLNADAEQLTVIKPELSAVGAIKMVAEFNLAQRGDSTRIDQLKAEISGAHPVATVQSLQAFEFNAKTGELKVADPTHELVVITLHGLPLAWAQPFLKDLALTGSDLRGEFAATANNGGLALHPRVPLTLTGINLAQAGKPLIRSVDLSLMLTADYSPAGWQANVSALTLQSAGANLFKFEAKAGQLIGKDQPLKATGKWSASLPALLAQPVATGAAGFVRGNAAGDFVATVAAKTEIQANLAFTDLAADPKLTSEKLPTINAEIRADIAADGKITLNAPLLFVRDGRKSDLTFAGTVSTTPSGTALDAKLTSTLLVVEDVQILAAPFAGAPTPVPTTAVATPSVRDEKPVWAGLSGQIALALKKVVYAQKFEVADVGGTIRIDAGSLKLDGVRAGFSEGSELKLNGGVTFTTTSPEPYTLAANLDVTNFDPAPVFRALNPNQPPTVEGKFTVASQLAGQARNLGELGDHAHGDFTLTSKGGVFRALSSDVSSKVEAATKTASAVAFLGNVASAVTGRKEYGDVASKAEAVAALSKMISAIQYDQLNVVLSRDAALNTTLKDFTLIAPELRLAGTGKIAQQEKTELLAEALTMQFQLGARGHTGDLLKALGALDTAKKDDLGYFASTLPLKVTGTLGKPDTRELQAALLKLAYEKSGAGNLLDKFLGGK